MTLLLREAIGGTLRRFRADRHQTLREVSREARVSLGYLSEIERGRKEASSELLAAVCAALGVSMADLLIEVALLMRPEVLQPLVPIGLRHTEVHRAPARSGSSPVPSPLVSVAA
jgi:transcriptional regulator with XRE-family HTH domain